MIEIKEIFRKAILQEIHDSEGRIFPLSEIGDIDVSDRKNSWIYLKEIGFFFVGGCHSTVVEFYHYYMNPHLAQYDYANSHFDYCMGKENYNGAARCIISKSGYPDTDKVLKNHSVMYRSSSGGPNIFGNRKNFTSEELFPFFKLEFWEEE